MVPTEELRAAMWTDKFVITYNDPVLPRAEAVAMAGGMIFLGGPTSREQALHDAWRTVAVRQLRAHCFTGYIVIPEPRDLVDDIAAVIANRPEWESERLSLATRVVFWVPRSVSLPGSNTNTEIGMHLGPPGQPLPEGMRERLFVGWPPEAKDMGILRHQCERKQVMVYTDLSLLCGAVAASLRR